MTTSDPEPWPCEAYGPEGAEFGAICFISGETGTRTCGSPGECRSLMQAERQRVFRRISELAAEGSETAAFLEGEFSSPAQILGGYDSGEGSTP